MLNYECPPFGGGGGTAAFNLAKGFIKLGYQVDYITSHFPGLEKKEVIDDIHLYRVPAWGKKNLAVTPFKSMLCYDFFALLKTVQFCLKNKYDFINTQFAIPTGPVGLIASKIFKIKNILTLYGGDIYNPSKKSSPHRHRYWQMIVSFILNQSNIIIADSKNIKKNTLKYFKPRKEIKIIPLAYKKIEFKKISRKELKMEKDTFYLIAIGRLIPRKGFKFLIKAMANLPTEIHLNIIGNGPLKEKLSELIKKLKLEKRIKLLGWLSEEKKFQYLASSDLYVLSSLHEGFGVVLQEAMQVGLPIVATNYGGQADILKQKTNALLIKPESTKELKKTILTLCQNPKLRGKMRKNNLEKISKYSPEKIARRYLKLVEL